MPSGRRRRVVRLAGLVLLWPLAFAAFYLVRPVVTEGPVLCPVRLGIGLPCPGCGVTRAFSFMAHGEFGRAIQFNAIAPLATAYLGAVWLYYAIYAWRDAPPAWPTWTIAGIFMLVAGAYGIGRWVELFSGPEGLAMFLRDNAVSRLIRFLNPG